MKFFPSLVFVFFSLSYFIYFAPDKADLSEKKVKLHAHITTYKLPSVSNYTHTHTYIFREWKK